MIRLFAAVTVAALFLGGGVLQNASAQNGNFGDIPKRLSPGVVTVISYNNGRTSNGTGFIVDDRFTIITNHHVVAGAQTVFVRFQTDRDSDPPRLCSLVDVRPGLDLAAIRLTAVPNPRPPILVLEPQGAVLKVLQNVLLIGQIVIQAAKGALKLPWSAHVGQIAAIDRPRAEIVTNGPNEPDARVFQMNITSTHGMSGSPILNENAHVVGVLFAGVDFGVSQITFGVPSVYVRRLDLKREARPFDGQNTAPILNSNFAGAGVTRLNAEQPMLQANAAQPGFNPANLQVPVGALNWGPVLPDPELILQRYIADRSRFANHIPRHILAELLTRQRIIHVTNPFFRYSVLVPETFDMREGMAKSDPNTLITIFSNPLYPAPRNEIRIAATKIPIVRPEDLENEVRRRGGEFLQARKRLVLAGNPPLPGGVEPLDVVQVMPGYSDQEPRMHETGRGVRYWRRYQSLRNPERGYSYFFAIVDDIFIVSYYEIDLRLVNVNNSDLVERSLIQSSLSLSD